MVETDTRITPCPFCGSSAVGRTDGVQPTGPYYIRCSHVGCPGHNTSLGFADPSEALVRWNMRIAPPPTNPNSVGTVAGFTTKDLIRGELVRLTLDRTGVFTSDKMAFLPGCDPLMKKPRDC